MHEFSLAQNIVEIVEESIVANNVSNVEEIVLEIGTLAGVEIPALELALESLKPNSVLKDSTIQISILEAEAVCEDCSSLFVPTDAYTACPDCGSFRKKILTGTELKVKSIVAT